ncbi:MAG: transcription termination/antitermination protein NusG [Terriglobales bacterium]
MSRNWRCGRDADRSERGEALEKNSAIHSRSPIATFAGDPTGAIALLPSSLHWHAVRTSPRHEKRVYEHLCYREVESFLPLYCQVHKWKNGCRARVDLPLFPGYLFVKIGHGRRVPVLEVPGILGFVGTKAGPARLEDSEIEILRAGLPGQKFEPHSRLAVGNKVRVVRGPLAGLIGVLARDKDPAKVVITVELIQQSLAVQLAVDDLELLSLGQ